MTLTIVNGKIVVEHLGYSLETRAKIYDFAVLLDNSVTDTDIKVHTRINVYEEDLLYLANKLQSLFENQISGLGFKSGDGVIDCLINKAEDGMYSLHIELYDAGVNSIFQMSDTISRKELLFFCDKIKLHLNKRSCFIDSIFETQPIPMNEKVYSFSMCKEQNKIDNDMVVASVIVASSFISMKRSMDLLLYDYLEKEKYFKLFVKGIGLSYSFVGEFVDLQFARFNNNKIVLNGDLSDCAFPQNTLLIKGSQVLF